MDSAKDAERAQIDKALQGHLHTNQRTHQVLRSLRIDAIKVGRIQTFRHASGMHHIVKLMVLQLLFQLYLVTQI